MNQEAASKMSMKAPMIGSGSPEGRVWFEFDIATDAPRVAISCGTYYREFLPDQQPFSATHEEWNTYLKDRKWFREVPSSAAIDTNTKLSDDTITVTFPKHDLDVRTPDTSTDTED